MVILVPTSQNAAKVQKYSEKGKENLIFFFQNRKNSRKMHNFETFLQKYLVMSKKSSTFARFSALPCSCTHVHIRKTSIEKGRSEAKKKDNKQQNY